MKFNVKRTQIQVIQTNGKFYIKHWGCLEPLIKYPADPLTLEQLKEIFTPADCESLDLVDPNRNERIAAGSGKVDPNYYKGEEDEQRNIRKIQESSTEKSSDSS